MEKAIQQKEKLSALGKQSAYDPVGILDMEEMNFFIDPAPAMQLLQYKAEDMELAIKQTVQTTLKFKGKGPGSINMD